MDERTYFTYIMASRSRTLYIGITGNLFLRVLQHKRKIREGFTAAYNCGRLVWFERFMDPTTAIRREKELKGWLRSKKIALIEQSNPTWQDLSAEWYAPAWLTHEPTSPPRRTRRRTKNNSSS
jgi:putative endonuclease